MTAHDWQPIHCFPRFWKVKPGWHECKRCGCVRRHRYGAVTYYPAMRAYVSYGGPLETLDQEPRCK